MPVDRFAGDIAARYDDVHDPAFAPDTVATTVGVLADLAGDGPALEFAIGTGRLALPLLDAGVEVAGIELSPDMVAVLRAKPRGDEIPVTVGDMAETRIAGEFSLVFLAFNTIMNLTTQDEQVACFVNAARHLCPGGRFLIECQIPTPPSPTAPTPGRVFGLTPDYLGIDQYDDTTHLQRQSSRHLRRRPDGGFDENEVPFRYVWPSEMDLMARLAGMKLEHRWADWGRQPFAGTSTAHVSVWRR